ncbi:hypothetical protein M20_2126 [Lactococcus lactis subsp. lactis]|uniref:Uncharacterized protein n=1 Tax=Lactococcus lactis subsp. lactis TaxID=1360 RepID=A0A0V8DY46_LACLL|nr:hypothetical protein M20_2126 [Lactococcus lactis subsp. lactis]
MRREKKKIKTEIWLRKNYNSIGENIKNGLLLKTKNIRIGTPYLK